jgi:hypothetical protein
LPSGEEAEKDKCYGSRWKWLRARSSEPTGHVSLSGWKLCGLGGGELFAYVDGRGLRVFGGNFSGVGHTAVEVLDEAEEGCEFVAVRVTGW